MPTEKQTLSRIKLQSHCSPRAYNEYKLVPALRMSGKWLSKAGFAIGQQVEIQEHPEGLLIKKIEE